MNPNKEHKTSVGKLLLNPLIAPTKAKSRWNLIVFGYKSNTMLPSAFHNALLWPKQPIAGPSAVTGVWSALCNHQFSESW